MTATKTVIDKLIEHVTGECTAIDQEEQFNSMLDECYSFESVGGIFANMSPSTVLKEMDPTAYHCGMNDYFGNGEHFEIGSDLYDTDAVEKARDEFIDGLDSELSDLETELEDTDEDEIAERGRIERQIHDLKADIETAKAHAF